jgi:hypothetical protein
MAVNLFFPGGIPLSHQGPDDNSFRSRWRETGFMLRQLCRAICPELPLAEALHNWPLISAALSESPRKRSRQIAKVQGVLEDEFRDK